MRRDEKPTGRTRYRPQHIKSFFSKKIVLVLQMEFIHPDGPPDVNGLPEYIAGTYWRDARLEDLTNPNPLIVVSS